MNRQMYAEPILEPSCDQIAAAILERTGSRIRQLRVEKSHDRVVIGGEVGSYYVNQLALSAAQGHMHPHCGMLEWQVRVTVGEYA